MLRTVTEPLRIIKFYMIDIITSHTNVNTSTYYTSMNLLLHIYKFHLNLT